MKKVLSLSLGLIFIGNYLFAAAGDYISVATGNWTTLTTWNQDNGAGFVAATSYPGQTPGTGQVTIGLGTTVTLDVTISVANAIGSLQLIIGTGAETLNIPSGFTLNVTGNVLIAGALSGGGANKTIIMTGTGILNCASLTLTPGNLDTKSAILQFNGGGTVNVTGNITMSAAQPQRTQINFTTGGTLNVGGNIADGQITPGTGGTVNFTGSGTQTSTAVLIPANTLVNLGVNNAASTLQLGANLTVTGTLTLTNGKINLGPNILTLSNATPASQLVGGSATSYVYTTSTGGRLLRQNLAAATAYTFPVGTLANYMPVTVTPTTISNFQVSVYTPATTTGLVGGPAFADLSSIVNAMWFIERTAGTGNSAITIQWADALEGNNFATFGNAQIGISQFTAGNWLAAIATSANAAANTVTATFSSFTVPAPFGVGLIGAVLPVKFGSIKAYEKQNGIQLDWKVYTEYNVKGYQIERSADGRTYITVGSLPALYNNTSDGDYGFFDANPLSGTSYYRIKNTDLDGKSAYSIVIRVNRNKTIHGLSLYPNPVVNGIVLLQGSDLIRGNYKINIFGANGQVIYKQQIIHNGGTISHTIELPSTISKGVYMLSVKDENGNIIFKDKLVNQ
jgi:hypothetical protein